MSEYGLYYKHMRGRNTIFIGILAAFLLTSPGVIQARTSYTVDIVEAKASNETVEVRRSVNPHMRVLIGDALSPTKVTSEEDFLIETSEGRAIFLVKAGDRARIKYNANKQRYEVRYNGKMRKSRYPIKATSLNLNQILEVVNFENRPAWNTELNDNLFYGSMEVVYSENSGKALLVNDLPIEKYVRGIAEVSEGHPRAHQKVIMMASRTYAYWHISNPSKHADEPYILNATEGDQVYRGAGFSLRSPNVVTAQKKTKRKVITYDGEPIIAAYFSSSDGRTRSWSEVWNGEKPYAVSVPDPCCTSNTGLSGHGVGLSGQGSRYFADQGWTWKEILKYYYTGVQFKKLY